MDSIAGPQYHRMLQGYMEVFLFFTDYLAARAHASIRDSAEVWDEWPHNLGMFVGFQGSVEGPVEHVTGYVLMAAVVINAAKPVVARPACVAKRAPTYLVVLNLLE